jgi:hypothetical protein
MGWGACGRRNVSCCDDGGIPVIGSNLDFRVAMVHEGVIRRSEEAFSDVTRTGISAPVARLIAADC